jgi:prevent-host-death family protein
MTAVGIREAKEKFSHYIKMVQKGATVVITERGRPVGKIVPIAPQRTPISERVRRLEESGVLEITGLKPVAKVTLPLAVPASSAQGYLQEDRGNG